jgi:uncharacterized protein (DUF58 family)
VRITSASLPETVELADQHPGDDPHTGLPTTLTRAEAELTELTYHYRPSRRGPVQFGDLVFWFPSRLMLWQVRKVCDAACTVPVYPDFSRLSHSGLDANHAHLLTGTRLQPRRGEGMEFHQLREYHPGDSLRQIDWKATARRRSLISREYQDEQNQQVLVMLDGGRRLGMPVGSLTGFDHALNAALLLAWSALKQKDKAGAMLFSGDQPRWLPPVQGQQGRVVAPHLLVPDLAVLGHEHVAHHVGDGPQPAAAAAVSDTRLVGGGVLGETGGDNLAVAVE